MNVVVCYGISDTVVIGKRSFINFIIRQCRAVTAENICLDLSVDTYYHYFHFRTTELSFDNDKVVTFIARRSNVIAEDVFKFHWNNDEVTDLSCTIRKI